MCPAPGSSVPIGYFTEGGLVDRINVIDDEAVFRVNRVDERTGEDANYKQYEYDYADICQIVGGESAAIHPPTRYDAGVAGVLRRGSQRMPFPCLRPFSLLRPAAKDAWPGFPVQIATAF